MTLAGCRERGGGTVERVCLDAVSARRLRNLGVLSGTYVSVVGRRRAAVIIKARGVRYAVGIECAAGIFLRAGGK